MPLDSNDERCAHCNAVAKPVPRPVVAPVGASLPAATVVGSGVAMPDEGAPPVTKVMSFLLARETLWTLFGLTVFTTILRGLSGYGAGISGALLALVATGLEIAYYFRVLTSVAWGETEFHAPDFSSLGEDVFDPLIRYVATLVPMIVAVFWLGELTTGHWLHGLVVIALRPHTIFEYPGPGLLFGAWLALWPLMTVIAAISRSIINTYNPATWVKTLAMLKMRYAVGALVFYALIVVEAYVVPPLAVPLLNIPYLGVLVIALVLNFAMALRACVLGMVCEPYR